MIYKNKDLLMIACNITLRTTVWYDVKNYAKTMYDYLSNCDKNDDWYTYYHNHTLPSRCRGRECLSQFNPFIK